MHRSETVFPLSVSPSLGGDSDLCSDPKPSVEEFILGPLLESACDGCTAHLSSWGCPLSVLNSGIRMSGADFDRRLLQQGLL